jgi:hypothetical protein
MSTVCPGCRRSVSENERIEIRGALGYHLGCAPTSAGAPRTIWEGFLALIGCWQ